MKKRVFILLVLLLQATVLSAQVVKKQQLKSLSQALSQKYLTKKAEALRVANEKGWVIRQELSDGRVMELQDLDKNGKPRYYITHNKNAAITVGVDELWSGGMTGLNLTGSGISSGILGEWDGGDVLTTHQELTGRVTDKDGAGTLSWHATHVAGTIIASGLYDTAKGMAYEAHLDAYDWNDDEAEMASAAASGMILSNHSYGFTRGWNQEGADWYWYGTPSLDATKDVWFGLYSVDAALLDTVAYNAPEYLIVKSSGNDRDDAYDGTLGHYVWDSGAWVWSTDYREPDGGALGYDCIGTKGVAKNILTVGSIGDIIGGYSGTGSVVMESYSSWGPSDDGRIKPDIVANGQSLISSHSQSTGSYATSSGTSMSSPNATGAMALLQEYYYQLHGQFMKAATLKGLVIHTADEAGDYDGPDYKFGWGLLNAKSAANLITENESIDGLITENTLSNGETNFVRVYSDGSEDLNATISWTDIPGTPPSYLSQINDPVLVHNLNVKVIKDDTTFYPWTLDRLNPANAATKTGPDTVNNLEKVTIQNPESGYYTIQIDHGGALSADQDFALIISGVSSIQQPEVATIPAGDTNPHNFSQAGVTVQFTTGNSGEIDLAFIRTDATPNIVGSLPSATENLASRYWTGKESIGNADGTYDITFDISGLSGILNCATLQVLKRDNSSSAWVNVDSLGGTTDRTGCPNTITVTGLTGFSDFAVGGGSDNPLPVEIAEFTVEATSLGAKLNWVTQTETDNLGFIVSRNGNQLASYKQNEALKGQGTSINAHHYSFTDQSVVEGETYEYALISVDYSGLEHRYPKVVEINFGDDDEGIIENYELAQNYPNPFNPSTTINFTMKKAGFATLKVFDILGRVVYNEAINATKGNNTVKFNAKNLTSGVYFYQLNTEGFSKTMKMMLMK